MSGVQAEMLVTLELCALYEAIEKYLAESPDIVFTIETIPIKHPLMKDSVMQSHECQSCDIRVEFFLKKPLTYALADDFAYDFSIFQISSLRAGSKSTSAFSSVVKNVKKTHRS